MCTCVCACVRACVRACAITHKCETLKTMFSHISCVYTKHKRMSQYAIKDHAKFMLCSVASLLNMVIW